MHAPTGAARWFNLLAIDFNVSESSLVRTFDVASMSPGDSSYGYWVREAKPTHPVLADPQAKLMHQLGILSGSANVIVVGCDGEVVYHVNREMDEKMRDEVWDAIDLASKAVACAQPTTNR